MSFYGNILNRVEEESFRVTMKDLSSDNDGKSAKWEFKQGNITLGTIDIPLQTILEKAEMVDENGDKFIKLTFRTEEGSNVVYINVTELNEDEDIGELKDRVDAVEENLANYATVSNGVLIFTKGQ